MGKLFSEENFVVTEFSLQKSGPICVLFKLFQKGFGDKLKVEKWL